MHGATFVDLDGDGLIDSLIATGGMHLCPTYLCPVPTKPLNQATTACQTPSIVTPTTPYSSGARQAARFVAAKSPRATQGSHSPTHEAGTFLLQTWTVTIILMRALPASSARGVDVGHARA